jgi:hypothetical protein
MRRHIKTPALPRRRPLDSEAAKFAAVVQHGSRMVGRMDQACSAASSNDAGGARCTPRPRALNLAAILAKMRQMEAL